MTDGSSRFHGGLYLWIFKRSLSGVPVSRKRHLCKGNCVYQAKDDEDSCYAGPTANNRNKYIISRKQYNLPLPNNPGKHFSTMYDFNDSLQTTETSDGIRCFYTSINLPEKILWDFDNTFCDSICIYAWIFKREKLLWCKRRTVHNKKIIKLILCI